MKNLYLLFLVASWNLGSCFPFLSSFFTKLLDNSADDISYLKSEAVQGIGHAQLSVLTSTGINFVNIFSSNIKKQRSFTVLFH